MSHEGHESFLESAEAAFDFAFGLGSGSDEMGHPQSPERALKLAFGIAMIMAGTRTEKAEAVGIDRLRDAVRFKGGAEVREVIPSGIRGDESSCEIEAGMVIDGQQERLFG